MQMKLHCFPLETPVVQQGKEQPRVLKDTWLEGAGSSNSQSFPGDQGQNKQVSAGSGKGKVSTSVRTRDGRAWLRAGGTTLGLEKVANKSLVKEQNST